MHGICRPEGLEGKDQLGFEITEVLNFAEVWHTLAVLSFFQSHSQKEFEIFQTLSFVEEMLW